MNRSVPVLALGLLLSACNPAPAGDPATPQDAAAPSVPEDAAAGFSGVGKDRAGGELDHDDPRLYEPVLIDRAAIVGTWSFDRSCASGDAMMLAADGKAAYDEWGDGTWTINAEGQLVLDLVKREPGVLDDKGEPLTMVFTAAEPVGDMLLGNFAGMAPDQPGRAVNAKRCPA
jgi:hypothetical protein